MQKNIKNIMTERSRRYEDYGLLVGISLGAAYGMAEVALKVYCSTHQCFSGAGFPIGFAIVILACVLPKTVGRATAGKVWEIFANKLPGKSDG